MKHKNQIKTKRLLLSPMSGEELDALIEGESDEHLKSAYGQMLRLSREHPAEAEWYVCWSIVRRDGQRVGSFCFMGPPEEGAVELGCGIDERHRRQGYAAEALAAAMDWAFSHEDVQLVQAETDGDNAACLALLKELGFVPDGQGREGPRFKKPRPAMSWMPIGMCFGVALGTALGNILDNTSLWLSLSICFGLLFGLMIDNSRKRGTEAKHDV